MHTGTLKTLAVAAGLGLAFPALPSLAADDETARGMTDSSNIEDLVHRSPNELDGRNVKDDSGQEIGSVQDIMRSREDGGLYAVISADEFLGLGGQDLAVPLNELQIGTDDTIVMSQSTRDQLQGRVFNKDEFMEYSGQESGTTGQSGAGTQDSSDPATRSGSGDQGTQGGTSTPGGQGGSSATQ